MHGKQKCFSSIIQTLFSLLFKKLGYSRKYKGSDRVALDEIAQLVTLVYKFSEVFFLKILSQERFYRFLLLPNKKLEPRSWLHLAPPGAGAELEPENLDSPGTGAELEPGKFESPGAGAEPEPGNLEKFRTLIQGLIFCIWIWIKRISEGGNTQNDRIGGQRLSRQKPCSTICRS